MNLPVFAWLQIQSEQQHIPLSKSGADKALINYKSAKLNGEPIFFVSDLDGRQHAINTDEYVRIYDDR